MTQDRLIGALLHSYRVVERISSGAQASIYRARHEILSFDCAVKTSSAEDVPELRRQRILREARTLWRLRHPHIISMLDCGFRPSGEPFLVLELLSGPTLADLIAREGPLDPPRARALALQIARALSFAHETGVIHRDLKPSNVMIVGDDRAKVLDFGIARIPVEADLTQPNVFIGTPSYVAPEQIGSPTTVGPSADLYSLGAMLYTMVSGRPPFAGATVELLHQHLEVPPEPLPGALGALALRLMQKNPARRPTGAEVIETLEQLELVQAAIQTAIVRRRAVSLPGSTAVGRQRTARFWILPVAASVLLAVSLVAILRPYRRPIEMIPRVPSPSQPSVRPTIVTRTQREVRTPRSKRIGRTNRAPLPKSGPSSAIPSLGIEPRLTGLLAKLRRARAAISTDELEQIESGYFRLREQWHPRISATDEAALEADVSALEARLDRAIDAPPPQHSLSR